MAFPTLQAFNRGNSGAQVSTHSINLPASIAAGDLLLIYLMTAGTSTASVTSPSSGWTEIGKCIFPTTSQTGTLWVIARIADGGEGSLCTVSTSGSVGSAHVTRRYSGTFGGIDTTSISVTTATHASGAGDANPNPPNNNPANWDVEETYFDALAAWSANEDLSSYPTNYGSGQTYSRWASGLGGGMGASSRTSQAASENPSVYTLSVAANWAAATVAIRPAAAGGSAPIVMNKTQGLMGMLIGGNS